MAEIGVLVVSYGSRAVSYVDALKKSDEYDVDLYIADKQRNPFNARRAKEQKLIPGLDPKKIKNFAEKHVNELDFAIVGPEKPIIAGARDILEEELDLPTICPTSEYALEESKVQQRELLSKCCPEVNPEFKVFRKEEHGSKSKVKQKLFSFLDEIGNEVAVKPDKPGYGKGVGVWEDHFRTREELFEHFMSIYNDGAVVVERKIDGEESSYQALCDGKHLVPLPDTRDYKRAFEDDEGPNTGGMGCYKDTGNVLPFLTKEDREKEEEIVEKIFRKLRGKMNPGLRGIPLYVAFMHSADGPKILEINSRGGDPEIQTVVPLIQDDFVDVCFKMINGNLRSLSLKQKAAVLTYKVPPNYGGFEDRFPQKVNSSAVGSALDMSETEKLQKEYGENLKVYPGSMELRDDGVYPLTSRTVCCIGYADDIQGAREISREAIDSIKGGSLWYRDDIASKSHIRASIEHMENLRGY